MADDTHTYAKDEHDSLVDDVHPHWDEFPDEHATLAASREEYATLAASREEFVDMTTTVAASHARHSEQERGQREEADAVAAALAASTSSADVEYADERPPSRRRSRCTLSARGAPTLSRTKRPTTS